MPLFLRDHLVVQDDRTQSLPYTSINRGRNIVIARQGVNVNVHGSDIQQQFEAAIENAGFVERSFVYITFRSAPEFFLDLDKLDKNDLRLALYKEIKVDGVTYYEATVCVYRNAVGKFLRKLEKYMNELTRWGRPHHQTLFSNIESIRAATLRSFWEEPEEPFPADNESVWWEVWLQRLPAENLDHPRSLITGRGAAIEVQTSRRFLKFPEHWVFLMRGTVDQVANVLLYTDRLSELRKPTETAEFFTYLDVPDQRDWVADLAGRINHNPNSQVSVCMLDTGVTIGHPLLQPIVPARHTEAINPAWSPSDGNFPGHGTPMAGLALFGNLTPLLANADPVIINHQLESIRIINSAAPHDPDVYGAVTQEAVARGEVINPTNKRMVCMAITSDEFVHQGRPSSWSSAIDQTLFGTAGQPNSKTLFFVSSGNVRETDRLQYPLINRDCSIEDPAQSFNAITVGAFTLFDTIDAARFPNSTVLAQRGAMSPCNTTSESWKREWCRKPDIVMEGGNHGVQNANLISPDSLQLLSISRGGIGQSPLLTFGDTSGATALASKFGAELYSAYMDFWPESIRALIIHSADWTPAMLGNRQITRFSEAEKIKLISNVGYGVPNMEKARYSANNSLSLIAERELQPYRLDGRTVKTNHFHLFNLPWPGDVLQELLDTEIKLTITLSYFIEPNPGDKRYELAGSYRSHGLRFKMIDRNESPAAFKARVSKAMRGDDYETEGSEHWVLGSKVRDKGSIHKDIWVGTAADLATRNQIAIYPVGGWWKTRKTLEKYDHSVRYSLVITIDAPIEDVDIFTPVLNMIEIELNS